MSKYKVGYKQNQSSSLHESRRQSSHFTFFVFIVISAIFWLLIKLSQEYSQTYNMKIEYKDIPVNRLLTKKIDSTVKFNIKARGFYLLELSLLHPDELIIHLNNYTIHKADEDINYISTLPLKEKIAKLLDINLDDISFSKNVLSFLLETLHSKEVEVVGDINLKFEGSYNLYSQPKISPKKVMIYGTKETLDSIDVIKTKRLSLDNVRESRSLTVGLLNPDPELIRLDPEQVTVDLQVEKFTQSSLSVKVNTTLSSYNIETFPEKVTVYFNVALKDYEMIKASEFMISPDLTNVDIRTAQKLHLVVKKYPKLVRNIRIEPRDVEFIIIK